MSTEINRGRSTAQNGTAGTKTAGKVIPRGSGAKECLVLNSDNQPKTPELVKRFRGMTRPEPGEPRFTHSVETPDKNMRHGVTTKSSLDTGALVNPPMKTKFEQTCLDQKDALYNSKKKAPLGASHDQSQGLPGGMNPMDTTFGLKIIKDDSAGDMINPQKTTNEVEEEYFAGRELYKKSHNDWDVGEIMDRDYDWSKFTRESLYGVPTPHDNSGSGASSAMHWGRHSGSADLVSKRLDDFRERTQPQLGQVHDPISDTLTVGIDHTFGTSVKADDFNAGALMHMEGPTTYHDTTAFNSGVLSSIRSKLKKNNFYYFEGLLEAFECKDTGDTGSTPITEVREVFFHFNVPLTTEMLDMLICWCTNDSGVLYRDLVSLINWKSEPDQSVLERVKSSQSAQMPLASRSSNYHTSSQMIKSTVGEVRLKNSKQHGVPTIRSDLPAPRIKRVGDHTNYGDESDAYGLMYPSVYSNRGVFERDFFQPRDKATIKSIFETIGVTMNDDVFNELWEEANKRDPRGQVSVESFRAIMEEVATKA